MPKIEICRSDATDRRSIFEPDPVVKGLVCSLASSLRSISLSYALTAAEY